MSDHAQYVDLLAAVVERAQLDAQGVGLSGVGRKSRKRIATEATDWLAWARSEIAAVADQPDTSARPKGRMLR